MPGAATRRIGDERQQGGIPVNSNSTSTATIRTGPGAQREKTLRLVQLALWTALTLILAFVPNIGYLPIPPFNPTTVHIPVIIGAILLGPGAGAFLGAVFGVSSVIQATLIVPPTGFMFSPFVPFGNGWSLVIAIVPRICVGLVAAYLYRFLVRFERRGFAASFVAALGASLTNTILVLGGVYLFFGPLYAKTAGLAFGALFKVLLGVVATNGIVEALVAAVAAMAVTRAVVAAVKHRRV